MLLPYCVVGALLLVSTGVVQNLRPYDKVSLIEPMQVQKIGPDGKAVIGPDGKPAMDTVSEQTIAQGPVASQEIIKELRRITADGSSMPRRSAGQTLPMQAEPTQDVSDKTPPSAI